MYHHLKLKAAAGLLSCGFFLFSEDMTSDVVPVEKSYTLQVREFELPQKEEEKLSKNIKFASFYSRFLQKKEHKALPEKGQEELLDLLAKEPDSAFLILFFAGEYQFARKEDKQRLAGKLEKIAGKNPGSFFLVSFTSDMLQELKKSEQSQALFEKSVPFIFRQNKEKKLAGVKKEFALYILQSLCRNYAGKKEYEKIILLLDEVYENDLFKEDLILLQFALAGRYFLYLSASDERKNFIFFWQKSLKEEAWDELEKTVALYRNAIRKKHEKKESIFPGEHRTAFQIFSKLEKYEDMPSSILLEEIFALPDKRASLLLLADEFAVRKKDGLSARVWKKLLNMPYFPENGTAFLVQSIKLQRAGNFHEAIQAQEKAYMAQPRNKRITMDLARLYAVKGRYKEGCKVLEAFFPDVDVLHLAASISRDCGETEQALSLLLQADLVMDRASIVPAGKKRNIPLTAKGEELSRFIYRQIQISLCAEKLQKYFLVEKHLKKLLASDPGNAVAMNFLGYHLACRNKDLPFAEKLIHLALEKEPGNYAYLDSLAWVKFRMKDFAGAKKTIDQAMEKAGKDEENIDVVILDHAGDIYFAAGKKEQALQYWKKALETYSPELDIDHILKKIHETAKSMEKKK